MQLHALRKHSSGKLKLTDIKAMFLEMRDQAQNIAPVLAYRYQAA